MSQYQALLARLGDLVALREASALLGYDQQTQMPHGASAGRARQLAVLARMQHEILTDDATKKLLDAAENEVDEPYESDAASMLRVVRKDYEEATRLPASFVAEWTRETTMAHEVWVKARAEKNFSIFQPTLERIMDLARRAADYYGYQAHPYDALLGLFERGMTTAEVERIFEAHRPRLVDLIQRIGQKPQVDDSPLRQPFAQDKQREFAMRVVQAFGFDTNRGVQSVSVHPFCTSFGVNDVRITTRFEDNFLNPALFGMMHEAGHAMYEQGVAQHLDGTMLAGGTTLGVHESQSRMWENVVGRSKGFWAWALPMLKETFPQLANVSLDDFYRAINKVQRSFIRVEADEATYNLHIILRFEIEKDLLTGALAVKDLPKAWNERFEAYFGMTPPDDAMGVLQDVHWSSGLIGYFPTYALGNLLSVQYYNAALAQHPGLPDDIANGKFDTLLGWLRDNIHTHGRKFTTAELTRRVTGGEMESDSYMTYLETKLGEIYGL
jgi:carboxypeptidase Taq